MRKDGWFYYSKDEWRRIFNAKVVVSNKKNRTAWSLWGIFGDSKLQVDLGIGGALLLMLKVSLPADIAGSEMDVSDNF